MWKFILLIILSFTFIGCEEQLPEVTAEDQVGLEPAFDDSDNNRDDEEDDDGRDPADNGSERDDDDGQSGSDDDDHSEDGGDEQNQPTVLRAAAMLSSTSETLRLGEQSSIIVTIMTDQEFEGGNINVSIDRSSLDPMDDGTYVVTDLSDSVVAGLGAGASRNIRIDIESKTMAPSFDAQQIDLVLEKDGLTKRFPFFLRVMPVVEVAIISATQTPYMYNRGLSTCFRHHSEGVTVIFSNRTNDFQPANAPCIHTQGALRHCNTSQRMLQDEVYINPNKPGSDGSTTMTNALYYDHFNSGDQMGNNRRLYFNVTPGNEGNVGRNGVNCD